MNIFLVLTKIHYKSILYVRESIIKYLWRSLFHERKGPVIIVVKLSFCFSPPLYTVITVYSMDVLGQFLKNGNFKLVGQDSKWLVINYRYYS